MSFAFERSFERVLVCPSVRLNRLCQGFNSGTPQAESLGNLQPTRTRALKSTYAKVICWFCKTYLKQPELSCAPNPAKVAAFCVSFKPPKIIPKTPSKPTSPSALGAFFRPLSLDRFAQATARRWSRRRCAAMRGRWKWSSTRLLGGGLPPGVLNLGPPVVPFSRFYFGGEGSPRIDYSKRVPLLVTSLLENLHTNPTSQEGVP